MLNFEFHDSLRTLISNLNDLVHEEEFSDVYILCDDNSHYSCYLLIKPELSFNHLAITIKAGEQNKTLDSASFIWNELLKDGSKTTSLLINLGGGMITDIGGFVASTYNRGIKFINIPTTLLGMVDASIGGKTGINFKHSKNRIGVFNNSFKTYICTEFLMTLPSREVHAGVAEMIKHGLIENEFHFNELVPAFLKDPLNEIQTSLAIKQKIVEQDFLDQNVRKKLNFGHTIGHAVESYFLEQGIDILHGEAIACGIICESYISSIRLGLTESELLLIVAKVKSFFSKVPITTDSIEFISNLTLNDKKNSDEKINVTLLSKIGESEINHFASLEEIEESLSYYIALND